MTYSASNVDLAPSRPSIIHVAVQLGLVALLVYVCARIMVPFLGILLWSVILAVMLHPLHLRLSDRIGNRWSASLIGIVGVAVVLVPMFVVITSLGSSIYWLVSGLQNHSLTIPPPPTRLADLPVVGAKLSAGWSLAAANLPSALRQYGEMLSKLPRGSHPSPAAWPLAACPSFFPSRLPPCLSPMPRVLRHLPSVCWSISPTAGRGVPGSSI